MRGRVNDTVDQAPGKGSDAAAAKRRSLKPLLALKPYILRHRGVLVGAFFALVISALVMLALPMALRRMIDHGFSNVSSGVLNNYFGMLAVIGLVLAVASASRAYLVNWLGERVVADVRADVFRHLATLGPGFFETTHSGEVMSRLTADTTQIKSASGNAISQLLRNLIMLIGAFVMLLVTSVKLSLIVLLAIPAIVLPLMAYGSVVRRLSRAAQDSLADSSAYASENLAAHRTMQAFTNETAVADRYQGAVERSFQDARARLRARAALTMAAIAMVVLSIVGVLWFGAQMVVAGEITGGRLAQFVLYAVFAGGALAELAEVWGEVSQAAGAAERLSELLAVQPVVKDATDPVALPQPVRGAIAFESVSFAYPDRADGSALNNVSFTVDAGETVALVGPSGAGKSTVLNLLLRFFEPQAGAIRVDGIDIRQVSLADLRGHLAMVSQDIALFADTVAENIRYGAPTATHADVERAAIAAQADAFIHALPEGYATRLGERGVTLSGGQRQRIAIARAILRDAPILLLDEATSALDAESEAAVQKALEAVMAGRTTIVIAHRLATIVKADRILVLDGGSVVEAGSHAELMRASGLYTRLAELQFSARAAE